MKKIISLLALLVLVTGCKNNDTSVTDSAISESSVIDFVDEDDDLPPPRADGLPDEAGPNDTILTLTPETLITHGNAYGDNEKVEIDGSYWHYGQLTKSASAIQMKASPILSWFGSQTGFARSIKKVTINYQENKDRVTRVLHVYTSSDLTALTTTEPVMIGDNAKAPLSFTIDYAENLNLRHFMIRHANLTNHTIYLGEVILEFY